MENSCGLTSGRKITAGEKLGIFLACLGGLSNGKLSDRFNHSASKISYIVHEVADCFRRGSKLFYPPAEPQSNIENSNNFARHFTGCLGAMDGSHIPAIAPAANRLAFFNRKGFTSQNVLGVCNFNMEFVCIHAGWEGSAHDSRVLDDAKMKGFSVPENHFYLADAGYAISETCLTPYRGVRYHLSEYQERKPPSDAKELFNYRHSQLRNVIERTWGVLKKRFPILVNMPSFAFAFQVQLVECACQIHNFIRMFGNSSGDYLGDIFSQRRMSRRQSREPVLDVTEGAEVMTQMRDQIADALWREFSNGGR